MLKVLVRCAPSRPVLIAIMTVFVASLSAGARAADIVVGLEAPLTGFAASDGKSARIAAEIAVDEINRAGGLLGRKVALKSYDDQAQGAQGVSIANKIVETGDTTAVISASYSEPTRAAATIFQAAKIPYISALASHPDITEAGDYVFRGSQLGDQQGLATAGYVANTMHKKRVTIVAMDNDFGASTLDGFKQGASKYALTIIGRYSFSIG